jgi:DnaK suppressor protein
LPILRIDKEPTVTPLSQDQIAELERLLQAREAELARQIQSLNAEAADAPGQGTPGGTGAPGEPGDEGDRGEYAIRTAVRHAEKERDQQELQQIEGARERMRQGRYGECVDCGAGIALARLRALPSAERCIPCQEVHEQRHSVMPPILPGP